ncbi:hypothetical protein SAMN05660297_01414 [Natronincola peptidivorans]|uniref:Uncharacterized protein n=1 Tax=Natronincola peptidivorans TaxID=426128 RepID=A0A1I0BTA8_9FIRM|nr:hypothetical protein [Natronincola peptidivorans]SET10319.1 hypothetical protein SAMN05660297_01414 [Natronincola peptidivorans]
MEIWKAKIIESIREIERAREDSEINDEKYQVLGAIITELQGIIED